MTKKSKVMPLNDLSSIGDSSYKNGISTIRLSSWKEFDLIIKDFSKYSNNYIWRGQRCDNWDLLSSFDRWYKNKVSDGSKEHREKLLKERLGLFKEKVNAIFGNHEENDNIFWALGQHYGLDTPLLDWTRDPCYAAYFAFYKRKNKNQTYFRVIYGLNKETRKLIKKYKKKIKDKMGEVKREEVVRKERFVEFLEGVDLRSDKMQNDRLVKQKGTFTKALNGIDISTNVEESDARIGLEDQSIFLVKILIPDKERKNCLEDLRDKKIEHVILFPDFEGAAQACMLELT